jgi:ribonuclease III family protein
MEFDLFKNKFSSDEVKMLGPLVLAFVGDSVYEVFVRVYISDKFRDNTVHSMHIKAISFVKAHSQSEIMRKMESFLNEEEMLIYKRGRNAKSGTVPKNADVREYRTATGFEALIGYLYLTEQNDRLNEIMSMVVEFNV